MKKNVYVIAILAASLCLVAACGKKKPLETEAPSTEAVTEAETESETETEEETETEAPETQAETEAETEAPETQAETEPAKAAVEVSRYFRNYEALVSELGMQKTDSWQMSDDSYMIDEFYLEYSTEYSICSMKNEGGRTAALYGILPGQDFGEARKKLEAAGWAMLSDSEYGANYMSFNEIENELFMAEIWRADDNTVTGWYWNNWPEGDFTEFFAEQGWNVQ